MSMVVAQRVEPLSMVRIPDWANEFYNLPDPNNPTDINRLNGLSRTNRETYVSRYTLVQLYLDGNLTNDNITDPADLVLFQRANYNLDSFISILNRRLNNMLSESGGE